MWTHGELNKWTKYIMLALAAVNVDFLTTVNVTRVVYYLCQCIPSMLK